MTLVLGGCILTFSQFLCASVCSALTASLVLVGKSVVQTIIGFFTFGGVQFHPLNIIGVILNICGGALYSYVKYRERKCQQEEEMEPLLPEEESSPLASMDIYHKVEKMESNTASSDSNDSEESIGTKATDGRTKSSLK